MLQLENQRSRFFMAQLVRAFWVLLFWVPIPIGLALAFLYGVLLSALPSIPAILMPQAGSASLVVSLDGRPIGGLQRGSGPWARYHEIPPLVVQAFLAVEDDDYFLHSGVDLRAIARAALANLQSGRVREGGSTITQQMAKMYVGSDRTYHRKLIELLMARRLEAAYSKTEILEAYLNRVYLGAGVHGVVGAARIYFDRSLRGLSLEEAATLAGIASAPSAFDPYNYPERALHRRNHVLRRMASVGFIDEETALRTLEAPLSLRERGVIPEEPLPYVTDHIRAELRRLFGLEAWQYGALVVQTPVSLQLQRLGERALFAGVSELDQRQGYRGPLASGVEYSRFSALVEHHFEPDEEFQPAWVFEVSPRGLEVYLSEQRQTRLERAAWSWAYPFDVGHEDNRHRREDATGLVEPGDVVVLQREPSSDGWRLSQLPRLEGALVSLDLESGYARAMVAGVDYDRSQFNRVLHGCRQPGSVFKPVVYSLALERGMTVATPLIDAPLQLPQSRYEIWRPRNADGRFRGDLLLRDALILSRNLPTIRLFGRVGVEAVVRRAADLGFTTPMLSTDALSLGASCVYPVDVAAAYGVFANGGYRLQPILITSVIDAQGNLLFDEGVFFDGFAPFSASILRAFDALREGQQLVLDPRTAYLMNTILRDVVRLGTGHRAELPGVEAAGKTGTTNAFDTWFVGYTQSLVTAVWVGSDRNTRPMGRGETGAEVALPIWVNFMSRALLGWQQGSLIANRPPGIELVRVDLRTGLLARDDAPGAWLPFREGSAPVEYALTPRERDLFEAYRVERQF